MDTESFYLCTECGIVRGIKEKTAWYQCRQEDMVAKKWLALLSIAQYIKAHCVGNQ
jgi:hypothetical protein